MAKEVIMPRFGMTQEDAKIVHWMVKGRVAALEAVEKAVVRAVIIFTEYGHTRCLPKK